MNNDRRKESRKECSNAVSHSALVLMGLRAEIQELDTFWQQNGVEHWCGQVT